MILPYSSGGGSGGGYPGVTSDGNNGLTIEGGLIGGSNGSDTLPTYTSFVGNLGISSRQGDYLDTDNTFVAQQIATLTGTELQATAFVQRQITRDGHVVHSPALSVITEPNFSEVIPSSEPLAQFLGPDGGSVLMNVRGDIVCTGTIKALASSGDTTSNFSQVSCTDGLSVWGQSVPGAQPSITGVLSAVIDANAKAVLTSIIAVLVGAGFATDDTT